MTTKRVNITSLIKKQLNGTKPSTKNIDTQDSAVLEHLEADMMYNPDNYATVNIMGIDVVVPIKDDKDER